MISIKDKIENVYRNLNINKQIFDGINIVGYTILWALLAIPVALIGYFIQGIFFCCSVVIWVMLMLVLFFTYVNPKAKKNMIKLGLTPTKGFFKVWANQSYTEYRLALFNEALKKEKLLFGTKSDIELVETYKEFYEEESKRTIFQWNFLVPVGIFLLFIVPVWSSFVNKIFTEAKKTDEIFMALKFSISMLILIYVLIYSLGFSKSLLNDYLNKKSNKYIDISRLLENLRINFKIHYRDKDEQEDRLSR